MADFERLLREAHKRGIKVIIDLVINHTSNAAPWFKAAANPRDPHHDWYSWRRRRPTSTPSAPPAARPGMRCRQAALRGHLHRRNARPRTTTHPAVRKEMIKVGQFWLNKGVDGFRLDAAQHIYFDFKPHRRTTPPCCRRTSPGGAHSARA